MKVKQKIALASAAVFSAVPFVATEAQEVLTWTPRSIDEIKADVTNRDNQQSYIVKYGDTLSTIASALNVDVNVLANLNKITNMDLIFPNTVLTTQVNAQQEVTAVEVQTPSASPAETPVTATADLETNEVKVDNQTVAVEDLTQPVAAETPAPSVPTAPQPEVAAETPAPAAPAAEAVAETPAPEAPVAEAVAETPAPEAPVAEAVAETPAPEAPVAEAVAETPAPEAPVAEVVAETPAPEAPAAEAVAETPTPEAPAAVEDQTYSAPATTTAVDFATLAAQNSANAGLQPKAAAFKEEIAAKFGITNIGGYRAGDTDGQGTGHSDGLAIDVMVPVGSALGDQVAQYVIDNMARADVSYIIWNQKFYMPINNIYGPANTWNMMPDRGGVTANHYDHVHISFNK
ncbi:surface immunogenic protein [Streptococcus sp. DD10]|uniref:LysM peptidoglycan-binding domain-containing protein n=1 Tax=Streptococcus sp. DD10 TaxID=1777878 RepID=UPI00079383B3|nr:LysM domain-containing protein [Streptococcus sp. DD10]KXT73032.1 surface immunogenic protein [Streptococcus sp. DD10]